MFRIGFGQDSHRYKSKGKNLVLGGVNFEKIKVSANSDGDAAIHALCNALEQAIGNNSFSTYADKMCQKGITDSKEYLKIAVIHIEKAGYKINNIGLSFECQVPQILPVAERMRKILAPILKIKKNQIGINATSGEKLTAFGKGEGVQVFAIVSLIKIK